MQPLSLKDIRSSFVNTSRREASQATPRQDLDSLDWDTMDLLGWTDPQNPQRAYALLPAGDRHVGIMLRAVPAPSRKAMCALCEDITEVSDVKMFVAKLAGPAGREGNTVGTMAHADFSCSFHARRLPTRMEGQDDPEGFVAARVERLRQNAERFAQRVLAGR